MTRYDSREEAKKARQTLLRELMDDYSYEFAEKIFSTFHSCAYCGFKVPTDTGYGLGEDSCCSRECHIRQRQEG